MYDHIAEAIFPEHSWSFVFDWLCQVHLVRGQSLWPEGMPPQTLWSMLFVGFAWAVVLYCLPLLIRGGKAVMAYRRAAHESGPTQEDPQRPYLPNPRSTAEEVLACVRQLSALLMMSAAAAWFFSSIAAANIPAMQERYRSFAIVFIWTAATAALAWAGAGVLKKRVRPAGAGGKADKDEG